MGRRASSGRKRSADWKIAHTLFDAEHFLGARREAGDRLCLLIIEQGEIVAVFIWCAAACISRGISLEAA